MAGSQEVDARDLPFAVRDIENIWIPMADGCRLAARVWLPMTTTPVPAILEYLPYRKRDLTRARDEPMHRYFAGHGYAAVRVDLRGSGDSEGTLRDEYHDIEQMDALAVIAWLAAQPWCSGSVGMMGKSWGGFNSLQVAARRPPALKAILVVCASDDRYADDAHYMGGCLLNENLNWGSVLFHSTAYPPDPAVVGDRWRALWQQRLQALPLFPAQWMRHPHRDDYWRRGSVADDYGAIDCPVYVIGGWADAYTNAVPRLVAGLSAPCKGLIGPWAHVYPHDGVPGPAIGFLQEALRWWDQWLKGEDTGIRREPRLRAWMQQSIEPDTYYKERPGRWVAESRWPSPAIDWQQWFLTADGLQPQAGGGGTRVLAPIQTVGLAAGDWCSFGGEDDLPGDQRHDDAQSLCFDSPPLAERLEIWGNPVVELSVSVDQAAAFLAVRLNDVGADGAATRVTYGLLNLAHRDGHDRPAPVPVGERLRVRVPLKHVAHAFLPGRKLRVAISTCYWPIAWPSAAPVTLTLHTGDSRLSLPRRPPRADDDALAPFPPPAAAPALAQQPLRPPTHRRQIIQDADSGAVEVSIVDAGVDVEGALTNLPAIDLDVGYRLHKRYRLHPNDPQSAVAEVEQQTLLRRAPWSVRVTSRTRLEFVAGTRRLTATLQAWDGEALAFSRSWEELLP